MTSATAALAETYLCGRDSAHTRRLLLLTYSFPPDTAIGALRWQKFARYAAELGWGLDVVTLDPSQLPRRDAAGLANLPDDVTALGVRHRDIAIMRLHRRLTTIRRRLVERNVPGFDRPRGPHAGKQRPDKGAVIGRRLSSSQELWRAYLATLEYSSFRRWARDAAAIALEQVVDPAIHVALISSGPPHMAHEAGRLITKRSGIPLVLDMRDPWGIDEGLDFDAACSTWYRIARFYERRAIASASLVVANTEGARQALALAYPDAAARTVTVMNGYDDDDPGAPPVERGSRFVIAFAGSIYLDRTPVPLFRALALLVARERLTPRDIGIELMGHVSQFAGRSVRDLAREAGVEDYVALHDARPRSEARAFLASAAVLVSLPQNSRLTVPAKLFEYMQFNSWIVALSQSSSATAQLLRGTSAATVSPEDIEGLAAVLSERLVAFRRGERPRAIAADAQFSRRSQATVLFDAIAKLDAPARRAAAISGPAASGETAEST
jgi:hypothetical protein